MHQITVNDLVVDLVRKDIKNLHLAVYPPDGRVRVAVPLRVDDEAVRQLIISKLAWIQRQRARFARQEPQSPREYISGETHYFRGRRYLLNVIYHDGPTRVSLRSNEIDLFVRTGSDAAQRKRALQTWYRAQLKEAIPPLMAKWETGVGVHVADWRVKRMKTRWGSCNIRARRVWLNLELAKASLACLEYIIVHELIHLLVPRHNRTFTAHMDRLMPQWRVLRNELNRGPLSHETWDY